MGDLHIVVVPSTIAPPHHRMMLGADPDSGTMFRYTGSNRIDIMPAWSEEIETYPLIPDVEMNFLDDWELVPADALESAKTLVANAYLRWKRKAADRVRNGQHGGEGR
jgi:hypothetical protein